MCVPDYYFVKMHWYYLLFTFLWVVSKVNENKDIIIEIWTVQGKWNVSYWLDRTRLIRKYLTAYLLSACAYDSKYNLHICTINNNPMGVGTYQYTLFEIVQVKSVKIKNLQKP